jgi:uncharacterized protein (TIGR03435 family)
MSGIVRRITAIVLVGGGLLGSHPLYACTAFCAARAGQVLVGNNEDYENPRTKLWFVPSKDGSFGRMYVGFDDMYPQGGMNERGLWFDGFAAPLLKPAASGRPRFKGNIIDVAMATCGTVEEVVRLFNQYDRSFLSQAILMFADASGDAASIEADAIVRKGRGDFVQTNFHQSRAAAGDGDWRFKTVTSMLDTAGPNISRDLFRRILETTAQKGGVSTLYSNIYELKSRTMDLYHFRDFDHVVRFSLDDELRKGERVLDIPSLFPPNAAAQKFAARHTPPPATSLAPVLIVAAAVVIAVLGLALYGVTRGSRRVRLSIAAAAGVLVLMVAGAGTTVHLQSPASAAWAEFTIGPASGTWFSFGPNTFRSTGVTLKTALSTAYDIPAVRVVGPRWLAETRYSITAVLSDDSKASFRSLLQQELNSRLGLQTHLEVRPFDVFVLTVADATRLTRTPGDSVRVWLYQSAIEAQDASMEKIAASLESVLRAPVIDETGLDGTFELDLEWTTDRVASITAGLERIGLRLTPSTRKMEALVVDDVRRDPALVLLGHVGALTNGAPPQIRQLVSKAMTIR